MLPEDRLEWCTGRSIGGLITVGNCLMERKCQLADDLKPSEKDVILFFFFNSAFLHLLKLISSLRWF